MKSSETNWCFEKGRPSMTSSRFSVSSPSSLMYFRRVNLCPSCTKLKGTSNTSAKLFDYQLFFGFPQTSRLTWPLRMLCSMEIGVCLPLMKASQSNRIVLAPKCSSVMEWHTSGTFVTSMYSGSSLNLFLSTKRMYCPSLWGRPSNERVHVASRAGTKKVTSS